MTSSCIIFCEMPASPIDAIFLKTAKEWEMTGGQPQNAGIQWQTFAQKEQFGLCIVLISAILVIFDSSGVKSSKYFLTS